MFIALKLAKMFVKSSYRALDLPKNKRFNSTFNNTGKDFGEEMINE
jgi:hypothetical protein